MPKDKNERSRKSNNRKKVNKTAKPVRKRRAPEQDNEDRVPRALRKENSNVRESSSASKKGKKNNGKKKFSSRHPKLMIFIKIMIILFLLMCIVGAGIVAGIFFGLFGDDFEITKDELKIAESNSIVVDSNGAVVANLSGTEKRKIIKLEDMADYLPKAYVAIEDERFYKHNGVDWKRTAGAIFNTIFRGSSSYGGSTITQQLVKNITDDNESQGLAGIMRKVKEWAKAYQVERMISKEQILELYLNILFVGGDNLHGVELGAEYYFNKSAKDLSLAECAYMAGINSSPMSYNPFDETKDNTEKIKNKTKTVLNKMKELGYINSDEEYNSAIAEVDAGLKFSKGTMSTGTTYSYHTDAVIDQVVNQVMEEKGISRQLAENYVYGSGLTIYSTVDNTVQTRLEEEYKKEKYIKTGHEKREDGTLKNEQTQSGMAIIDYKTGYVVGIAGGLGEKTGAGWNRATQMKRQTGSSIKPIADVVPALEEKIINAATMYDDVKTNFIVNDYEPKNDGNAYSGPINIRQFIALSRNVPAVKIMKELTPEKSIEYLKKMGLSSIDEKADNVLALAIGGMTHGASPLEMAAAYGSIANDGIYITPTFYTKVEDSNGNVVLTSKQEQTRVMSEQNAYITKTILQEPVKSGGTATYCAIPGMDVAAKTGTTDDNFDRWLCGFTPYYSAATWFGYDENEEVRYKDFSVNPAGQIWDAVMTDIHENLENAKFIKPTSGIVEATVCRATGGLATTGCTNTYVEIFTKDNMPNKCEGHGAQEICQASGKLANEYCPRDQVKQQNYGVVLPKEKLNLWKPVNGTNASGTKITEVCDIHKKPEENIPEKPNTNNETNTSNNTGNSSSGGNAAGGNNTGKNNTGDNVITPPDENNNTTENNTGDNTIDVPGGGDD